VAGISGAIAGAIVAVVVGLALDRDDGTGAPADTMATATPVSLEITDAVARVSQAARPGVVRVEAIRTSSSNVAEETGSGVILDSDGHVLTNAHVILGADSLIVVLADGSERPAILIGHDYPYTDIAVLQIGPADLTPIPVGSSSSLALGDPVIVIGNPLAEFDGSVSFGVVSGLNRRRAFAEVLQEDLIQTDAAVNAGNSGGALLNLNGELVGIPTAVLRESRNGVPVEGIAFALPVDRALPIAQRIIETGDDYPRPTLGVDHVDLDSELANRFGTATTEGALVTSVAPGGPADIAGIARGDVITAIGEHPVDLTHPFLNALAKLESGEAVRVVLSRGGRIIETEVELGTAR